MEAVTKDAYHLFHEGSLALARMEANGIRIDEKLLQERIQTADTKIHSLEEGLLHDPLFLREWRGAYGERAKLGSSQQLGHVLYGVLGLPVTEWTAGGVSGEVKRPSTSDQALRGVDLAFVKNWLRWQEWRKVRNTFLEGIRREAVGGFLHPFFHLASGDDDKGGAQSFRSSSSEPNFQNFPSRDSEMAAFVRGLFVPREGRRLVELDFKGVEVSVSCCYHKDPVLIDYVKDPSKDMHRDMAAECFLLPPEGVGKKPRYVAKNGFVFPQFYGSYYVDCAKNLWAALDEHQLVFEGGGGEPVEKKEPRNPSVPTPVPLKDHLARQGIRELGDCDPEREPRPGTFEAHIKAVERDFWGRRFQVYARWKESWWRQYQETAGFDLLTGFRVRDKLYARNQVINIPIQGAAFHCLLWTLIRVQKWLRKNKMKTLLVGQVHDSLLADVAPGELQDYLGQVAEVAEVDLPRAWDWIIVPLRVEAEVGPVGGSWWAKRPWTLQNGRWRPEK